MVNPDGNLNGWVNKSFRLYYSLQVICDHFGIKCIQSHGTYVTQLHRKDDYKLMQHISENPYYDFIDNNINFIGWPIITIMGGFDLALKIIEPHGEAAVIGPLDQHPNAFGHKLIAECFYENL